MPKPESTVTLIQNYLDSQPPSARFNIRELAKQIGRSVHTLHCCSKDAGLTHYQERHGTRGTVWHRPRESAGRPKAKTTSRREAEPEPPTEDDSDRLTLAQSTIRNLTAENDRLRTRVASIRQSVEAVAGAVRPIKAPTFTVRARAKTSGSTTAVLCIADWHLGEHVFASQTGGHEYDPDIARTGMLDIASRFLEWVETQRHGYSIDNLTVLSLGDLTSGSIHPELIRTNSLPATVATARAAELLAEVVGGLAPHFSRVKLVEVSADNHGRLDVKPPSKGAAVENWCYLVHRLANALLAKFPNVETLLSDDPMPVVEIEGHSIMALHGHQIRGGSNGSPYYGITRHFARVMQGRYEDGLPPLAAVIMGHLHHFSVCEERIILAPSLIGPSEFSVQRGLRGKPAQLGFLVGDRGIHGLTCFERRTA